MNEWKRMKTMKFEESRIDVVEVKGSQWLG